MTDTIQKIEVPDLIIDVDDIRVRIGAIACAIFAVVLQFIFPPTTETKSKANKTVLLLAVILGVDSVVIFLLWESWSDLKARRIVDPGYPVWSHLYIALYSFAFLTVSRVCIVPLFQKLGDALIPKDKDKREVRVQRFAGQLWKVLFHGTMTVLPMIILRGQPFWPPGFGDAFDIFENYPYTPQIKYLREFYMLQLGYYLHAFVATLMQRGRPNLVQMTVHHMATLALVFVSYFVQNAPRFGSLVLWVHDVCDVPVSFTRLVVDLSWTAPTAISYTILMLFWVVFRLIIYPFRLLYITSYTCFKTGAVKFSDAYAWLPLLGLLYLLVIMHWQWFFELAQMGKVYLKTGARVDSTEATDEDMKKVKEQTEKAEKKNN